MLGTYAIYMLFWLNAHQHNPPGSYSTRVLYDFDKRHHPQHIFWIIVPWVHNLNSPYAIYQYIEQQSPLNSFPSHPFYPCVSPLICILVLQYTGYYNFPVMHTTPQYHSTPGTIMFQKCTPPLGTAWYYSTLGTICIFEKNTPPTRVLSSICSKHIVPAPPPVQLSLWCCLEYSTVQWS